LTGESSASGSLANTGATSPRPAAESAALLMLSGFWLLLFGRRRRTEQED
jgi:LPXTG-motif cell wall-anchored protein